MNNYKDHFKKMKSNSHPVRMKQKQRTRKPHNRKSLSSLKAASVMLLALSASFYGFLYPESIIEIADRVTIFSAGHASEAATPAATKEHEKEEVAVKEEAKKPAKKAGKSGEVSDNTKYIQHLEERKTALDEKEKQLKELEEKLQLEKVALEKKVEELEAKRRDIASKLESRVQADEESLKKLVDMYTNMKPQNAAQVMVSLDDELAINVLKRMKKQTAGNILNFMPPQKAKSLSEKYTGY